MPIYLEDKQLVKKLLAGDERAYNRFFDENFSRLYRFAYARLAGDPESTREVVHASLTKALQKLHTFRSESALFTWLCVICRHEISDWLKVHVRYRQHIILTEDEPDIRAAVDSLNAPPGDDPRREYQRTELRRLIQVALDKIPAKYGDALEWKYIEGHSIKEIARRMDLSREAAQSTLARAKRAFQEIYSSLSEPVIEEQKTQSPEPS